MAADPIRRFNRWLAEARAMGIELAEACALATADAEGRPSVRYVLLKDASPDGFTFFTNLTSRKGRELVENPRAALAFYWHPDRQVRVEGPVEPVGEEEADMYWSLRTRESRLAARASDQSAGLENRSDLSDRYRREFKQWDGEEIPRPEDWSGFRILPESIEFWTREEPRLHKREVFLRTSDGWKTKKLQP
ncbi:MAG: pyridoxamine 5'-phosphate oxidase [bacterium]